VTGVARSGKPRRFVVGIIGIVVILHVARAARRAGQVIVAIDVALQAGQGRVCSGKRKTSGGVIEFPAAPRIGVMTILAGSRKTRLLVVGIGSVLIVLQVARDTGSVSDVVVAIDVAL